MKQLMFLDVKFGFVKKLLPDNSLASTLQFVETEHKALVRYNFFLETV